MELWIRSQNKMNLACVYSLYVIERDFAKNDSIWWEIFCNDEISLGLYLKERALEVLDEIQCHLVNINDSRDSYFYVYEMPKE